VRIGDFKYRFVDSPAAGWVQDQACVPYLTKPSPRSFRAHGLGPIAERKPGRSNTSTVQVRILRFVFVQQQVEKLVMTAVETRRCRRRELSSRCRESENRGGSGGMGK